MKLLTLVVPSYNSQDYLEKCINSLHPWDDRLEILIVNDGSKDRTGQIADEFAAKYPGNVRALHQENGGHGEGINHGLREATGLYFKTVDSDDTLSKHFDECISLLEKCEEQGGVDLFLTDYRYIHSDGINDRTISFANALPTNRIFTWSEAKRFKIDQIMMIHTCTFRTKMLREIGTVLPKHIFYEDNFWVYSNLAKVEKVFYMPADLYHYTIGRDGQSVQEDVMKRRYKHQIKATELCIEAFHLDDIKNKPLRRYLSHELEIMLGISIIFARLNKSAEAEKDIADMWKKFEAFDPKQKKHFRHMPLLWLLCLPGKAGAGFLSIIYGIAHKLVRFN